MSKVRVVDLYDKISDPDIRDFFPQEFFPEANEDDLGFVRTPQPINWYQYPFRSVHAPTMLVRNPALERRRQWQKRYWKSLENKKKREAKWFAQQPKRREPAPVRSRHPSTYSVPVIDGEACKRCGKTFVLHHRGVHWLRVPDYKLAQIAAAVKRLGYKRLGVGYHVSVRGGVERTIKFANCNWEMGGVWVSCSFRAK